jgi:hypothetical protein
MAEQRARPVEPAPPGDGARPTSCAGVVVALVSIAIGLLHILNLGAGVFFEIPDNLPVVGNLDEAGAAGMVILGVQYLARRGRERRAQRRRSRESA